MSAAIALAAASILCASLDRIAFSKALARLKHLTSRRAALPVLESVLIEGTGDQLVLTATDLNLFVRVVVAATVATPSDLLVPLRKLVEVTRNGARQMQFAGPSITLGSITHRIAVLPPVDFPAIPKQPGAALATLLRPTLARLLAQTTYAMSDDDTRPQFAALLIERRDGALRFVTTDGHRLAVARVPDDGADFTALIPRALVEELRRMVDVTGGVVRVHRDGDRVWFVSGEEWVSGRLVDATFPSYEQLIPSGCEGAITMPTGDLRAVLHALAPRGTRGLKLTPELNAAQVRVGTEDSEGNATESQVLASFTGNVPSAIGFEARYLREVVDALTDDDASVTINVWGELDPVRVDCAQRGVAVIMPLRV